MDFNKYLLCGVEQSASDLHLSPGRPPMLRVDGDLVVIDTPALGGTEINDLLMAIMTDEQKMLFKQELDLDMSYEIPGVGRFRVNTYTQANGPAAAVRIIPPVVMGMEELQMGDVFKRLTKLPNGLILITGPTGSGKSATLSAMIDFLNSSLPLHIITLEDPIEQIHQQKKALITQREVGRDAKSFERGLRAALREDPDVIMVGELRDLETIRLALTAAETGHLVLGTLHTISASKTIDRIIDAFPAEEKALVRSMLSDSLQAVISQALMKKVGGGRIAAREIMLCTPAIRNLIREAKPGQISSAIETGGAFGMITLAKSLRALTDAGLVSPEEVAARLARADGSPVVG